MRRSNQPWTDADDDRLRAFVRPIIERQLAAVRQHDGVRDRKSETEIGCAIHIPCIVAAYKWFQHHILARIGNAGTIVFDLDRHADRWAAA